MQSSEDSALTSALSQVSRLQDAQIASTRTPSVTAAAHAGYRLAAAECSGPARSTIAFNVYSSQAKYFCKPLCLER